MNRVGAADRLVWAVQTLAVRPDDRLLEVGCGHGIAVSLVCEKLDGGAVVAIDRSPRMIAAARKRNADHVAAGTATFQTATPLDADLGDTPFEKVFAINVGVFWRQQPARELEAIGRHLAPDGKLFLFYELPPGTAAPPDAGPAVANLEGSGFVVAGVQTRDLGRTSVGCVVAEKGRAAG